MCFEFQVMEEIKLDYRRVMCDFVWQDAEDKNVGLFDFIVWKEKNSENIEAPLYGKVKTLMECFEVKSRLLFVLPCFM